MDRLVRAILMIVLAVAANGCAALGRYSPTIGLESRGIFQPAKYPKGDWVPTAVLVQDAYFAAADGTKLHGWYVGHPQPVGHAVFLHGNAGNVTLLADTLRALNRRHNLAVLALDYRGFGRSEGKPTEHGLYQDARAARAWLAEREQIAEPDVVLIGVSVGGAVAVDLAASDGARGLVLMNTFTSLPAAAQRQTPWLPMGLLLATRMNSLAKIKQYEGPVLISHADADEVVPLSHGQALFEAVPGPKRMVTCRGVKHNDQPPEEFHVALDAYLSQLGPVGSTVKALAKADN